MTLAHVAIHRDTWQSTGAAGVAWLTRPSARVSVRHRADSHVVSDASDHRGDRDHRGVLRDHRGEQRSGHPGRWLSLSGAL